MNKEHTHGITQRFLQICSETIQEGRINNRKEFCEQVGEHQQNLSQMDKGRRAPTLDQLARACKKFGYSPNWLILNIGNKKLTKEMPKPDGNLEHRINILETEVARLSRNMRRIKPMASSKDTPKSLTGRMLRQGTKRGTNHVKKQ